MAQFESKSPTGNATRHVVINYVLPIIEMAQGFLLAIVTNFTNEYIWKGGAGEWYCILVLRRESVNWREPYLQRDVKNYAVKAEGMSMVVKPYK